MSTPTASLHKLLSVMGALSLILATRLVGFAQPWPPPAPPPPTPPNGLRWSWATALDHPTLNGLVTHSALVVDAAGNQYVTGSFQGTVAFGNTILRNRYPGDEATQLYVAKLSPTGQWLWAVTTGSATSTSNGADIALDAQGRLVVAGFFTGSLTILGRTYSHPDRVRDVLVARLSTAQGQWLSAAVGQATNGSGASFNVLNNYGRNMLALDAQGNAIITGNFFGGVTFGGYPLTASIPTEGWNYVASLSAATNRWQWAKLVGTNPLDSAQVVGVATGPQGDIWLTGQYRKAPLTLGTTVLPPFGSPNASTQDVFLGHLSATGQWLGASRVGGPSIETVTQIVVDGQNNLYLTGSFSDSTYFGNVALTSPPTQPQGFDDAFVAKRNANGQWEWARSGGSLGTDTGLDLAVDAQGEVYWTGKCFTAYSALGDLQFGPTTIPVQHSLWPPSCFISKIGPAGQWRWTKEAGQSSAGYALAGSSQGQVYLATTYENTPPFLSTNTPGSALSDVLVGQVSAQGTFAVTAHSESGGTATVAHVIHDEQGNSYATGYFTGTLILGGTPLHAKAGSDAFVAKLNRQGAVQWALQAGGKGWDGGGRLALDEQGGLMVQGTFSGDTLRIANSNLVGPYTRANPYENGSGFLARISPQGQWLGAVTAPTGITGMQLDAGGALTIAGSFNDTLRVGAFTLPTTGDSDGFVARLSATNQWQWVKQIGTRSFDLVTDMVVDSVGTAYVTGPYGDSLTFGAITLSQSNTYVAAVSAAGQWQWAKPSSSSYTYVEANRLAMAPDRSHLLVSGVFAGSLTLDSVHLTTPPTQYQETAFVGAIDLSGHWLWGMVPGGDGLTVGGPVAADRYGTGYLLGGLVGAARFGTDSIHSRPGRRSTSPAPFLPGAHLRGGPPLPPTPSPFIAAFTEQGQWQWAELALGATTVSASAEGDLYMGGSLGGTAYLYYASNNPDSTFTVGRFKKSLTVLPVGFVTARLNGPTGLAAAAAARATFGLWPNPAHHSVQLVDLPKGATSVRIVNAVGAVVMQQAISGNSAAVTLNLPNGLVPGLYVVQCGGASRRLVVE